MPWTSPPAVDAITISIIAGSRRRAFVRLAAYSQEIIRRKTRGTLII
jgi:hypothetical protein